MPIKWDATADQFAFIVHKHIAHIFLASEQPETAPSARAVSEHLLKLRKEVGAKIGIGSTPATPAKSQSPPKKRAAPATPTPRKKAKKGDSEDEDDKEETDEDEVLKNITPRERSSRIKKEAKLANDMVKYESDEDEDEKYVSEEEEYKPS
ncbi:hypothetical protein KEM55_004713 [Ascosphaera atra]|nr:hypothetical protein KEM55_004713 [Ascosphaera atra]